MAYGRRSTEWRDRGEQHYDRAAAAAEKGGPTLDALLAIYCELRHAGDPNSDANRAMHRLAGNLDQHGDTMGNLPR